MPDATPDQQADASQLGVLRFLADVNQQSVHLLLAGAEQFLRAGKQSILLLISSPGGSVHHGLSAYNYLKGLPIQVDTHNFGSIDSIATTIYSAGEKRYSVPNGRFLIHSVGTAFPSDTHFEEKQLKERLSGIETDRKNIAAVIAKHCEKKLPEIEKLMVEQTIFMPQEAKDFGLVHEIRSPLVPEGAEVIGIG
jgi:ATP-dependent Clp protease protease subunit